jgi:hypothetical protein
VSVGFDWNVITFLVKLLVFNPELSHWINAELLGFPNKDIVEVTHARGPNNP